MLKQLVVVISISLASLLLFWTPFLVKIQTFWGIEFGQHGLETIVQNFDGPNYIAVAKTGYNANLLQTQFVGFANPPIYYAAHFPGYPLIIRFFDYFLTGPQSLLVATIVSNILLAIALLIFFRTFIQDENLALLLSIVALFFPARILSVRAVGSSEALYISCILLSLTFAYKSKDWWAAILGSIAVLTRSPGILLFGAYMLAGLWRSKLEIAKLMAKIYPYLLMPLTLTILFCWYQYSYGDFWAYFNSSSELHPVFFPPFLVFSNTAKWISDMWREEIIYIYLFYSLGISLVKNKTIKIYGFLTGSLLLLTAHRDLARYALPLAPMALLGLAPYIKLKHIKWLLLLIVPIYLLGWQFVVANVQAISDWSNLL